MKSLLVVSVLLLLSALLSQAHAECRLQFERPVGAAFSQAAAEKGYVVQRSGSLRDGDFLLALDCRCSATMYDPDAAQCEAQLTLTRKERGRMAVIFQESDPGFSSGGFDCVGSTLRLLNVMPVCAE